MTEIKNEDGYAIRINLNCVMKIFKRYRVVQIKPGLRILRVSKLFAAHNLGSSRIYGSTVYLVTQICYMWCGTEMHTIYKSKIYQFVQYELGNWTSG